MKLRLRFLTEKLKKKQEILGRFLKHLIVPIKMTSLNTNGLDRLHFTIGQLICILAYYWPFVLYDVIVTISCFIILDILYIFYKIAPLLMNISDLVA